MAHFGLFFDSPQSIRNGRAALAEGLAAREALAERARKVRGVEGVADAERAPHPRLALACARALQ